jgi:hypothetical protein
MPPSIPQTPFCLPLLPRRSKYLLSQLLCLLPLLKSRIQKATQLQSHPNTQKTEVSYSRKSDWSREDECAEHVFTHLSLSSVPSRNTTASSFGMGLFITQVSPSASARLASSEKRRFVMCSVVQGLFPFRWRPFEPQNIVHLTAQHAARMRDLTFGKESSPCVCTFDSYLRCHPPSIRRHPSQPIGLVNIGMHCLPLYRLAIFISFRFSQYFTTSSSRATISPGGEKEAS